MIKTYSELMSLPGFEERFLYLQKGLVGHIGEDTFGYERYLNQMFYRSSEWKRIRNGIILRDNGCELGDPNFPIPEGERITIHHMNTLRKKDIEENSIYLRDPEFLITMSFTTHNLLHYGANTPVQMTRYEERSPNDTCPWRK